MALCPGPNMDVEDELAALEGELRRLEAEYNMFFAGQLPRPPWETRGRVESMMKRLDRVRLVNTAERFRFSTLQLRFHALADLWERSLRAREEGRPALLGQSSGLEPAKPRRREDRILYVTTFSDPAEQPDRLRNLCDCLNDARRESGETPVPFQKFAELITAQVAGLKDRGSAEVAFRVAIKDGKVSLTARALRGAQPS